MNNTNTPIADSAYTDYDGRRYSSFTFAHCRDIKYGQYPSLKRDYHGYCTGHFTNKRGHEVYCNCECHEPPERD